MELEALAVDDGRCRRPAGSLATRGGLANTVGPHDDHLDVGPTACSELLEHHTALIGFKAGGVVAFRVGGKGQHLRERDGGWVGFKVT